MIGNLYVYSLLSIEWFLERAKIYDGIYIGDNIYFSNIYSCIYLERKAIFWSLLSSVSCSLKNENNCKISAESITIYESQSISDLDKYSTRIDCFMRKNIPTLMFSLIKFWDPVSCWTLRLIYLPRVTAM